MGIKRDSERKEIEKLDKPAWFYSSEHRDIDENELKKEKRYKRKTIDLYEYRKEMVREFSERGLTDEEIAEVLRIAVSTVIVIKSLSLSGGPKDGI